MVKTSYFSPEAPISVKEQRLLYNRVPCPLFSIEHFLLGKPLRVNTISYKSAQQQSVVFNTLRLSCQLFSLCWFTQVRTFSSQEQARPTMITLPAVSLVTLFTATTDYMWRLLLLCGKSGIRPAEPRTCLPWRIWSCMTAQSIKKGTSWPSAITTGMN